MRGLPLSALLFVFGALGCKGAPGPAASSPVQGGAAQSEAAPGSSDQTTPAAAVDLSITFDPRFSGNIGWVELPKAVPLHRVGSPGAAILDISAGRSPFRPGDPDRARWLKAVLALAPLAHTSLLADEESLCSKELAEVVAKARPSRLLLAMEGGLSPKSVGCLRSLRADRFYLAGCLYRDHRPDACDGDAELSALASDEALRPRVRGLAVSLSKVDSVKTLGRLSELEYLALSPGRGAPDEALFDALPFNELNHVRYLEASGENHHASAFTPDGLRFIGRLHTLRWYGDIDGPIPAPCALERISFDRMRTRDVEALAACQALKELSSDGAEVESAEPVARLSALKRLHLRHFKAESAAPLAGLRDLRALSLPASKVLDFNFISSMPGLLEVDLSQTSLSSLDPLRVLSALDDLDVGFTAVRDLSPLSSLTKLRRLDLHETKVVDITPIARLTSLNELTLSSTAVTDLSPLKGLPLLERVILYDSKVTDAGALLSLPKLKRANIRGLNLPNDQIETLRARLGGELYD